MLIFFFSCFIFCRFDCSLLFFVIKYLLFYLIFIMEVCWYRNFVFGWIIFVVSFIVVCSDFFILLVLNFRFFFMVFNFWGVGRVVNWFMFYKYSRVVWIYFIVYIIYKRIRKSINNLWVFFFVIVIYDMIIIYNLKYWYIFNL